MYDKEKPYSGIDKHILSLRDIGRLVLSEIKEWLDRNDTEAANALNTPDDET